MPVVKDSYDNEAEAQLAADKMQAYTDEHEAKRKPTSVVVHFYIIKRRRKR